MKIINSPLTISVLRGNEVESQHFVDALVVNDQGQTLLACGDVERSSFPRSAIKPFQALLFSSVCPDPTSELSKKRMAVSSGSHWAEQAHVSLVRDWLKDLSLQDDDLVCGPQTPRDLNEQKRLIIENRPACRVHNNCSGKHTGFLAYCQVRGYSLTNYGDYGHPLQKDLRTLLSEMSGVNWNQLPWGLDGCGIPTSFVPLKALTALGVYLAQNQNNDERVRQVIDALRFAPEMIAGEKAFCTKLIRDSGGNLLVKTGAEGNYWGTELKSGNSFFLKVRDGSTRAAEQSVLWILQNFCTNTADGAQFLTKVDAWMHEPMINWAGERVGELRVEPLKN